MSTTYTYKVTESKYKYSITEVPSDIILVPTYYRAGDDDDRPIGKAIMIDHSWVRPTKGFEDGLSFFKFNAAHHGSDFGFDRPDCDYFLVQSAMGQLPAESYKVELLPSIDETKDKHYPKLDPWKLQQEMESSGNAFVDARRADTIKYAFRMKGDKHKLLNDLKKARHCIDAAVKELEANI